MRNSSARHIRRLCKPDPVRGARSSFHTWSSSRTTAGETYGNYDIPDEARNKSTKKIEGVKKGVASRKRLSPSDCLRIIKHNGEISRWPIPARGGRRREQRELLSQRPFRFVYSVGKRRAAASMHSPCRDYSALESVWSMRPTLRASKALRSFRIHQLP